MKAYEYLASGLPIISTNYYENLNLDFNELLFICDTTEEINTCLEKIRSNKININNFQVSSFLNNSTWEIRVNEVLKVLNQLS
jgi:hypothetical protein